jgi:hypothetical protein
MLDDQMETYVSDVVIRLSAVVRERAAERAQAEAEPTPIRRFFRAGARAA